MQNFYKLGQTAIAYAHMKNNRMPTSTIYTLYLSLQLNSYWRHQTPVCFLYATVFALCSCRQVQASLFCLLHISHFGICHETWLTDKGKKQIRQNKLAEYWVSGADEIPSVCTLPERTYTMVENTFDAIRGSLWALWSWVVCFPSSSGCFLYL